MPVALNMLGRHERLVLRFHDVIAAAPDLIPPAPAHVADLLDFARDLWRSGSSARLLLHCHAGFSRSPAALALILAQAAPTLSPAALADRVLRLRPCAWPNSRMIQIGDALLARQGAIVEAAQQIYRIRLAQQPELAQLMLRCGRQREVAGGRWAGLARQAGPSAQPRRLYGWTAAALRAPAAPPQDGRQKPTSPSRSIWRTSSISHFR